MVRNPHRPIWDLRYEVAAGQEGHFTTAQAGAAGDSPQLLAKHLRARRIQRVRRGVYRIVHYPAGDHEDLVVLWLWSDREGIFSHETALALHDLSEVLPAIVHMTLPAAWAHRRLRIPRGLPLARPVREGDHRRAHPGEDPDCAKYARIVIRRLPNHDSRVECIPEMRTSHTEQHHPPKTLGAQAARLVTELHDRARTVFILADVEEITGLSSRSARSFVGSLVRRGVATRLEPGLFTLIPFELGHEREYPGNPLVVAREIVGGGDYYISHASAMEVHRMVTQPQLVVYVTAPKAIRSRSILGTEFRFVRAKPEHMFGITAHWATKTERVRVSDLERTVVDGLKQSEYCGGITEVAKGFWMRREDIDAERLVDHALRLDVGAVIRRLGFLLELFEVDAPKAIARLDGRLTRTYAVLDPLLPTEGRYLARWRIRLNVEPEEILSVVGT